MRFFKAVYGLWRPGNFRPLGRAAKAFTVPWNSAANTRPPESGTAARANPGFTRSLRVPGVYLDRQPLLRLFSAEPLGWSTVAQVLKPAPGDIEGEKG
jgi:hypothetical protein